MAKDFVEVYEVSIFADVMCCTVTLCVVMMMIQIEILVEFQQYVVYLPNGMIWNFCFVWSQSTDERYN